MRKKALFHIGLCIVTAFALTACNGEKEKLSEPEKSEQSSVPAQSGSDPTQENSAPAQDDYVMDDAILDRIRLVKDPLSQLDLLKATEGLECKTVLAVQSSAGDHSIGGIYIIETGLAMWMSDYPNYHYFWIDRDGNELDHVGFDFVDRKDRIPDRDYPGTGIFNPSSTYGSGLYYYQNGRLKKNVTLPQCHRSDLIQENSQYLYIDPERENLTLYDIEKESAIKTLSAESFGLGNSWVIDFVHAVTPNLATVTLLEYDENNAIEYNGSQNFRTFLLELPTLRTVQKLPDGTELIALDDNNFIMTEQEGKIRIVSLAKLDGEKLTETKTDLTISEVSQFFNSANIILSPNKKVALLRDWVNDGGSYLRCRAISTDSMQVLWEFRASSESGILLGYPPAAITDDAVLYMFNEPGDNSDRLLYRVGVNG